MSKTKPHGSFICQLPSGRPLYRGTGGRVVYWYIDAHGTPVTVLDVAADKDAVLAAVQHAYGTVAPVTAVEAEPEDRQFEPGDLVRLNNSYPCQGTDLSSSLAGAVGTVIDRMVADNPEDQDMIFVHIKGHRGMWCPAHSLELAFTRG